MLCSLHDSVRIEDRGRPAVLLCTDVFHATARAHATSLGVPDLAIVTIPNPLSGISAKAVRAGARDAVHAIAAALTDGRS